MYPVVWLYLPLLLKSVLAEKEKLTIKTTDNDPRGLIQKYDINTGPGKTSLGAGGAIFCMQNIYLENGKFKEVPMLQKYTSKQCNCTVFMQCEDPKDDLCLKFKSLQFDCKPAEQKVIYNRTEASLRITYPSSQKCEDHQKVLNPVCAASSQKQIMDMFRDYITDVLEKGYAKGKDSIKHLRSYRVQIRIWEAGIYAFVYRHAGDVGKLTHDREKLIWIPLAVSFLLIIITAVLFVYLTFIQNMKKTSKEE